MNTTRWRLLSQLAERAAGHDQPQRLAYGSLEYTDARNGSQMVVYGLAQCTGDLEPSECTRCLMYFLAVVSSGDMANATRRSVWGFSCHLRYQVNDPIDVIAGPPAPSPQPAATPSGSVRINADSWSSVRIEWNSHRFRVVFTIQGLHLLRSAPRAAKLR